MEESKLNEIIKTSLSNIKEVVDSNTIIGQPIQSNNGSNTVIIPISKISIGYASGGVDYLPKNDVVVKSGLSNFGGGGGTGISITPVGFLVIKADGNVEMINVNPSNDVGDALSSIIAKSPDIINKIKGIISKKEDSKESKKNKEKSKSDKSKEDNTDETDEDDE